MYHALEEAFGPEDWPLCPRYDRGDGALILVPPIVPKARLVTSLPSRLETALARHNAAAEQRSGDRAAATQIQLRIAVHAGEVTFDEHGVLGAAIDDTFRLVEEPLLKTELAGSQGACALIASEWFYSDVVYHHEDAQP